MKVSLNWVRQFTDITVSTDDLLGLATERLGGIEGVSNLARHYQDIVVAKVVSCQEHPNADKLSLCKIDDGGVVEDVARDDDGLVQVVCGAPNVRVGLLTAWIPPSAVVPASYGEKELFVLEARELRGELSNGMLASPRELGLNDDHEGIIELQSSQLPPAEILSSAELKPGAAFADLFGLNDTIIEIENKMFTHRPDGFGQLGVARELAGIQGLNFSSPDWFRAEIDMPQPVKVSKQLVVDNQLASLCQRYMAVVVDGVSIKPSPLWLQSLLKRVGVKPINNVVDITNYLMLLTAQPLHAFDFAKVAGDTDGAQLVIRHPQAEETISLLDGRQVTPHAEAVLICNQDQPLALGGVMGGGNSEIDSSTSCVILECASFDMYNIRKTSMRHGIFTEAVTRFNKGQPVAQLPAVMTQAIELLTDLAAGRQASLVVDSYPTVGHQSRQIELELDFINARLGSDFTAQQIQAMLAKVEIIVEVTDTKLNVKSPFWRTDLEIAEDIVEEVGRLHGFSRLPTSLPRRSVRPPQLESEQRTAGLVRQLLASAGANEVTNYSFVHGDLLERATQVPEDSYRLRNALSPNLQYYRQSLLPSLLDLVHPNIKADFDNFALFEIGKTHRKSAGLDDEGLPLEESRLALVFANQSDPGSGYFQARRLLDFMAERCQLRFSYWPPTAAVTDAALTAPFAMDQTAEVLGPEGQVLGLIGELKSEVATSFRLPQKTAGFELRLDRLAELVDQATTNYRPLSRFPTISQDVTLTVPWQTPFAKVDGQLRQLLADSDYQVVVQPLGVYQAEEKADNKNISFRLSLSHPDRTLTKPEANRLTQQITDSLSVA